MHIFCFDLVDMYLNVSFMVAIFNLTHNIIRCEKKIPFPNFSGINFMADSISVILLV